MYSHLLHGEKKLFSLQYTDHWRYWNSPSRAPSPHLKSSGSQVDSPSLCPFSGKDPGKWQRDPLASWTWEKGVQDSMQCPWILAGPYRRKRLCLSLALVTTEACTTGHILSYTTRDDGVSYFGLIPEFLPCAYHRPNKQTLKWNQRLQLEIVQTLEDIESMRLSTAVLQL